MITNIRISSSVMALLICCSACCRLSNSSGLSHVNVTDGCSAATQVVERDTNGDKVVDVREYGQGDVSSVLVLIDKNSDGRPDLMIKYEQGSERMQFLLSDIDFDGIYDVYTMPGNPVLRLKDQDGDGWPDQSSRTRDKCQPSTNKTDSDVESD